MPACYNAARRPGWTYEIKLYRLAAALVSLLATTPDPLFSALGSLVCLHGRCARRRVTATNARMGGPERMRGVRRIAQNNPASYGVGDAGGKMEVDADADAVCREDQCGAVGDGESGGGYWARRFGLR